MMFDVEVETRGPWRRWRRRLVFGVFGSAGLALLAWLARHPDRPERGALTTPWRLGAALGLVIVGYGFTRWQPRGWSRWPFFVLWYAALLSLLATACGSRPLHAVVSSVSSGVVVVAFAALMRFPERRREAGAERRVAAE